MSSSKKKVTLHDFFSPNGTPPVSFKRKQKDITVNKRKTQDIIVIDDSDSEIDVVQTVKRHRHTESSDEVEFVDNDVESCANSSNIVGNKTAVSTRKNDAPTFGSPYLLLHSSSSQTSEPFGKPTLLLRDDSDTSLWNQGLSTSISPDLGKVDQTIDFDLPINVDDDWDMGDDELAFVPPEEEELEGLGTSSLQHDPSTRCPSCAMLLDGLSHLELARHVNDCLDAQEDSSKETPGATSAVPSEVKPLHPLSSFEPPSIRRSSLQSCDRNIKPERSNGNIFSVLMSSHKENEAWKEASVSERPDFRPTKNNGGRRMAPFYKILQGMPIAVDAFRYGSIPGVTAYFLTHAHSDHYTNLASNWKSGPIYCSEGTANLIDHMLSVDRKWLHPLPYDVPTEIPNTGGVHVTLIEANHCPGSCLFFFEGCQTVNAGDSSFRSPFLGSSKIFRYLHCGDFRASPRHVLHPAVKGKRIDHVYLDTTYLDPKYTFPPQPLVISACAELARRLAAGEPLGRTSTMMDRWTGSSHTLKQTTAEKLLIIVGTYSIGKERIVKAIAHALNSKVYCDARKTAILRCQADAELDALLTSDPFEATVHLVPLGTITSDRLKVYVERFQGKFTKAIGFRPTGWTYTPSEGTNQMPSISSIISHPHRDFDYTSLHPARNSTTAVQLYPVPYSEHSSFFELTCFAMSFDWVKMIATVNVGSERSRSKMANWVTRWESERKKKGKVEIVPYRNVEYW
ncbi:hypothetical protein H0H93_004046 [Arthromyces matolae]|nr:hypothetical protein H0H93_004046 [Arthromyces matolae]